jgi:hypothetical protein
MFFVYFCKIYDGSRGPRQLAVGGTTRILGVLLVPGLWFGARRLARCATFLLGMEHRLKVRAVL